MTNETLQQKISPLVDRLLNFYKPIAERNPDDAVIVRFVYELEGLKRNQDKALQEFREQIEAMKEEHMFLDGYKGACIDVLDLLGTKDNL